VAAQLVFRANYANREQDTHYHTPLFNRYNSPFLTSMAAGGYFYLNASLITEPLSVPSFLCAPIAAFRLLIFFGDNSGTSLN
jgi:hypothetical protein